jgi:hypothetical protein
MPCSRAIRRATGDALARPPLPSGEGAAASAAPARLGLGSGRRGRLGRGGRAGRRASLAPAVARRCGLLRRLGLRAVAGRRLAGGADARDDLADGQRVALLGDDRQRPRRVGLVGHRGLVGLDLHELVAAATSSPSALSHLRIVPSSIESDRRGMTTSGMPVMLPTSRRGVAASASARRGEQACQVVDRHRPGEMKALPDVAAERQDGAALLVVLDALGHRAQTERVRQGDDRAGDRRAWPSPSPATNERSTLITSSGKRRRCASDE